MKKALVNFRSLFKLRSKKRTMAKYFNFRVKKSNINTLSTAVPKFHYQSFLFSISKNVAKGPLNFNQTDALLIVSLSIDNLIGVKKQRVQSSRCRPIIVTWL